jgi:hypothetical protein
MISVEKDNYGKFKWLISEYSIKALAKEDGIELSDGYREISNRKYYMAWDKRDGHMIRYLVNHGFFKARFIMTCKYCGEANSRTHVTNNCPAFDKLRARTWNDLDEIKKGRIKEEIRYKGDLEKALLDVYFKPGPDCVKQLEVLKKFSLQLVITNAKKMDSNS